METGSPELAREATEILSKRLRPFLLRRTKEQVATDLPEKSEINHYIGFREKQSQLYEAHRALLHEEIRERVEKEGLAASQIHILQAITKLRQICCHPALIGEGIREKMVPPPQPSLPKWNASSIYSPSFKQKSGRSSSSPNFSPC